MRDSPNRESTGGRIAGRFVGRVREAFSEIRADDRLGREGRPRGDQGGSQVLSASESHTEGGRMGEHESDVDPDEVDRRAEEQTPVTEAGGGESEGFELAEEDLVDNAEGSGGDPLEDRLEPEDAGSEGIASYGEPDEIEPTEVVEDDGGESGA